MVSKLHQHVIVCFHEEVESVLHYILQEIHLELAASAPGVSSVTPLSNPIGS